MGDDKPWHRRIIICCDGTWQSSVSGTDNVPSNVTKLCRHIARIGHDRNDPSKKFHQLVYYDSGIGTGNLSSSERRRQGGVGAGLTENVIEAYNFVVLNYEPGDEIFCFGFSRGAYTARAVAGLITDIGVLKPIHMQMFPAIYRAYQANTEGKPFRETQPWKDFVFGKPRKQGTVLSKEAEQELSAKDRAQSWEIRPHGDLEVSEDSRHVKVVGVWDTVGSLGVPDVAFLDNSEYRTKFGFHNVKLNGYIAHAFHALALDEHRKAFRPTLWYIPTELEKQLEAQGKPLPELRQVWFPGVHINCGGGSDDAINEMKGDLEHISAITFCWMLQCIAPYLTIDPNAFRASMAQYQRWLDEVRYNCTYHHTTWIDWMKSEAPKLPIINPAQDPLAPPKRSKAHAHPNFGYGYGTGPIVDSYTGMYHLAGSLPRIPGRCQIEVLEPDDEEYRLIDINGYGDTNEYIHPVCHYRNLVRGHEKTSPLRDFTRSFQPIKGEEGKGRFWWQRKGDSKRLPEWIIAPHGGDESEGQLDYERVCYSLAEKTEKTAQILAKKGTKGDWLASLDEQIDFNLLKRATWVYP